jgi:cell division protein FtsA
MEMMIAGLDIGTSKVSGVLGRTGPKGLQVLGMGISANDGMRKGVVVDIEGTAKAIRQAVEQLNNMTNMEVDAVYINISGGHASLYQNRGVIAVTRDDREIMAEDVHRVIQSAQVFALPPDKEIVDVVPRQFIVDGYEEIRDPVGMFGTRLEVDASIIACNSTTLQNIVRSVERAGLQILGVVIEPLALGEVLLTQDEKDLGVVVIDVGAGKTEYSVFEGGLLKSSNVIPLGGDNITNDLAVGLKIPFNEAELLKRKYGIAKLEYAEAGTRIPVKNIGEQETRDVSIEEFTEIIEARVYEILFLVNRELVKSGIKPSLSAGAVITGGGVSFLKGCKEIAQEVMGLPIRIGAPEYIGVSSPVYSSGVGIIRYISNRKFLTQKDNDRLLIKSGIFGKPKSRRSKRGNIFEKLKSFFEEYF